MNAPPILRHEDGRFLPGMSANPSGRPRGAGAIRELARQYVPDALKKIGELIGNADPRVALAASQEILSRVYGRPVQAVESEVRKLDMNAMYLQALKLVSGDAPALAIDVTPELHSDDAPEATEDPVPVAATIDW